MLGDLVRIEITDNGPGFDPIVDRENPRGRYRNEARAGVGSLGRRGSELDEQQASADA